MSASSISTKPNPRERPVSRSLTIDADRTLPNALKKSFSSASVARQGRFPT